MDPSVFLKAQARFARISRVRLVLLSIALAALWLLSRGGALSPEEAALWERVRNAEETLSAARYGKSGEDPERLGLIGVEWSPISTTLGSLPSKRTAADPLWSVVLFREMARMGLRSGDRVAVLASGSFPGFVLNALAAAEALGCRILFAASLGASQWGANDPACPWPLMEGIFHRGGFLKTRASWYTLGGEDETGGGIGDEGRKILTDAAAKEGIPLLEARTYDGILAAKVSRLETFSPGLVITVGGSSSIFGVGNEHSGNGFLPKDGVADEKSIVGWALSRDIPVFHAVDFRFLAKRMGVPFDAPRSRTNATRILPALFGLGVFFVALLFHSRWKVDGR